MTLKLIPGKHWKKFTEVSHFIVRNGSSTSGLLYLHETACNMHNVMPSVKILFESKWEADAALPYMTPAQFYWRSAHSGVKAQSKLMQNS